MLKQQRTLNRSKVTTSAWRRLLWQGGFFGLFLASVIILSLPPNGAAEEKGKPAAGGKPNGMPVEAVQVATSPLTRELTAVGTLQADEAVVLGAEIAGRISMVAFNDGEPAKKGQVLLRLDDSVLKAELDRAKASLGLSQANYKRAETLLKDHAISKRERDEAYAKWQLDEATVRLAEANLAKTVIRAPFSGRLGLRNVSPGGYLKPGDEIVNLVATDPIKVDFRVPESFAGQVRVGQTLDLIVDAVPGTKFPGKVVAIAPQLDTRGRSLLLRARVANDDQILSPGMFARVALILEQKQAALMIPEEALMAKGAQQLVYKVVEGKVEVSPVEIGLRRKGQVEILSGLSAGETVITAGHLKVRPGMPVMVLPQKDSTEKPGKGEG
ncbi:MAG: efflux transporter periplasmic adaptor subunit [Desulfuromonas sp.]|nr:MAG: efflux transporter periplasmic adaptor subunit [Desulfuromonas sp.]